MFCSQCGNGLNAGARFCSACGSPISRGDVDGEQKPDDLVGLALGADPLRAEMARNKIIESVDLMAMSSCVTRSMSVGDLEAAEFWYLETITADNAPTGVIRKAILAYCRDILEPCGRLAESEVQLILLNSLDDEAAEASAREGQERLIGLRRATGAVRHVYSDGWRSVDVSLPLDPSSTPDFQYLRTIAYLCGLSSMGRLDLPETSDPAHIPFVEGLILGMRNAVRRVGADTESMAQGIADWLTHRPTLEDSGQREQERHKEPRVLYKKNFDAPTSNELGGHLDELFSADPKMASQIKRALGVETGLNREHVVAYFWVSSKMGLGVSGGHWLLFTQDRVGLFEKKAFLTPEESIVFKRSEVALVGFGDSDHYEAQGITGTANNWVSITIELVTGERYTRHTILGSNENEVNKRLPRIKADVDRLSRAGYPVGEGPGWHSEGGFRTSYGFGVIR